MTQRSPVTRWWLNVPIRNKGFLVLALPFVAAVVASLIRLPIARLQDETAALLTQAAETRDATQDLLVDLLDIDSNARGYVLTGDRAFVAPFEAARQAVPARLKTLQDMLARYEEQQVYAEAAAQVERKVGLASALVTLIDDGATIRDPAVQRLLADSKTAMDAIRSSLGRLRRDQDAVVSASQAELGRLRNLIRPVVQLTLMAGLFGALVAASLFGTGISRRVRALERNAERLARGERLRRASSRGADEIGSLDTAIRRASLLLRTRERELRSVNGELQRTVHEQRLLNNELEAFTYSVSHDLRAPLRSIDGFAQALREDWGERLDETGQDQLARVRNAAQRMGRLIDDLLKLSTVTRAPLHRSVVDVSELAHEIIGELRARNPTRNVQWVVAENMRVRCDPSLARVVLDNLLGNAWKFTSKTAAARIEFCTVPGTRPTQFVIRDNGAGFDMRYVEKLFAPFQRLHGDREFPGSGIGLATVQRIVHKHGGSVRTEAVIDRGATFTFTLEPADPAAAA